MEQDTLEWHEHRARYGNASEAAAVMDAGRYFPRNRRELARVRLGIEQVAENPAMRRGKKLEPEIREAASQGMNEHLEPAVMVSGNLSASLDGITPSGLTIVELKAPYKGRSSELWREAENGRVPEHYWWQVQQQLLCSEASGAWFVVGAVERDEAILKWVWVDPDSMAQMALEDAWDDFFARIHEYAGEPDPDLAELNGDPDWREAAERFKVAKAKADQASEELKRARERLIELADPMTASTVQGDGVRVQKTEARGAVDYKAALQHYAPGVTDDELELFRKKSQVKKSVNIYEKGD